MNIRKALFGNALATESAHEHTLDKRRALAVFSSDALSSVAYATEEILLVMVTAGAAALWLSVPIALIISLVLVVVTASYWQTIQAYPSGGGAFIVALDNLGEWPGLFAAAALLIDYVLTVAVSVSAGIYAVNSAFPQLASHTVTLCVVAVLLITWANLRGMKESAGIFALPTYAFILMILAMVAGGAYGVMTGSLHVEHHVVAPPDGGFKMVTLLLLLRAFSSGCSAMTGVEAVSNGVPAFRPPAPRNAGKTLLIMSLLLGIMFVGITLIADHLHVVPNEDESVLSQVAHAVFGNGLLYYALQVVTALILLLAANTSFAGFPMLASVLAKNEYLPKQLSNLGDRLAFSNGIMALAGLAIILIVAFGANTHALVPLYSVGVFLSFSLSQAGMVKRWVRIGGPAWGWKAAINGFGAVVTSVALAVILESKFAEGAWIVVLLVPMILFIFRNVKRHYGKVSKELSPRLGGTGQWLRKLKRFHPKVVVPVSKLHRGTLAALYFARSISDDVTAVVVDLDRQDTTRLQLSWQALQFREPLVVLPCPYRSIIQPLMEYLEEVDARDADRGPAMVVLPMFVPRRWWHHLLHNQTALMLKAALLYRKNPDGETRVIVDVPYHLTT